MKTQTYILRGLLLASLVICAGLFSNGCATSPTEDPSSPTGDLNSDFILGAVIKAATSEGLSGNKEAAQKVIGVTQLIIDAVESGTITVPEQIDLIIRDEIAELDLEPSTRSTVMSLYQHVKQTYVERVEIGQIDPEITAPLVTILRWVRDAAQDTLTYGTVETYGAPPLK